MKDKIQILLFASILFIISLLNLFTPQRIFSDRENRFLETLPKLSLESIMDGKFNEKFQDYSADQFIFRDKWISLKSRLDLLALKKDNGRVYFGENDYLFEVEEDLDEKKFLKKMEKINALKKAIDIPLDIMLIPTKSTIVEEFLPYGAPVIDEIKLLEDIEAKLDRSIGLFSPLKTFKNSSEKVYYKTDHHYTSLGAYLGYSYYMEQIGEKPYDLDFFEREIVTEDFLGSLFRKSSYYSGKSESIEKFIPKEKIVLDILKNEKDQLEDLYDESFLEKSDKYSFFLGGDHPLLDIKTSLKDKDTLLIVKDSFANSLIPFLSLHYGRIIVIDPRYFNIPLEDYIGDKDIDRILYLYNIRSFYDK